MNPHVHFLLITSYNGLNWLSYCPLTIITTYIGIEAGGLLYMYCIMYVI